MKRIIIAILISWSFIAFGQKEIVEGVIIFKQAMSSDNEQMNAQLQMVGDMMTTTYFKENKSRTELLNPMTGDVVSIFDTESSQMFMSMNSPMAGKIYTLNAMPGSEELPEGLKIDKGKETRNILGYQCQQYLVQFMQGADQMNLEMYVTPKIKALNKETLQYLGNFDGGFPLYIKLDSKIGAFQIKMIQEATDLRAETVEDSKFNMAAPDGYKKVDSIPGM
ncbi:MAG: hypothetical protein AAGH46_10325 [Bacteroidota bacterium]